MEFEPMLAPREKSPLPKESPEDDRTHDAVDSEPKRYQRSYSCPSVFMMSDGTVALVVLFSFSDATIVCIKCYQHMYSVSKVFWHVYYILIVHKYVLFLIADAMSWCFFFSRHIHCVSDLATGMDDALDCHQQGLRAPGVLLRWQHRTGRHDSHERHPVLPLSAQRLLQQEEQGECLQSRVGVNLIDCMSKRWSLT